MNTNTSKIISLGELAARIPDGAALGLGGVFYLYSNPQLVIMLTDQLWACF